MARKGAMSKEPLRGEARKAFKQDQMRNLPGPGGQNQLGANPQGGGAQQVPQTSPPVRATPSREKAVERLSPGVYRGSRGGLVGQGGRPINRQQPAPQQPNQAPQWDNPMLLRYPPGTFDMQRVFGATNSAASQGPQSGNYTFDMGLNQNPNVPMGPIQGGNWMGGAPANPQTDGQMGNQIGNQFNMPADKMYRYPQFPQIPQMPQPSANMGGQYRLSPGVYGNQQQAMDQYNQQLQQMQIQPASMPYRRSY